MAPALDVSSGTALASAVLVGVVALARAGTWRRRRSVLTGIGAAVGRRGAEPVAPPGWVIARLRAVPLPVQARLQRAGLSADAVQRAWRWGSPGLTVVLASLVAVGGLLAAVLVAAVVAVAIALVLLVVGDRAAVLVDRELPALLATVAAGVRSGASLRVAIGEGAARTRGPVADDLNRLVDELATGHGLVEVLDRWADARPTAGVRMTGAALSLAAETGGAGARTIDGVAATLRDRLAVDRELAALSSQARASAIVIGLSPLGFVILTGASDPAAWTFFVSTPAGLACLAVGCVLDAAGAAWMTLVARGTR